MANTLLNIDMIVREALAELKGQLAFTAGVNRNYDDRFAQDGAKIGDAIRIRKPVRHQVNSGAALSLNDVADQSVTLTLDQQKHVDFQFSSKDMTLNIEEFKERYLKTAITALANQIDADGCALYKDIPSSVGTPEAGISSMTTALEAGQKLSENGAPVDGMRSMVVNPAGEVAFLSSGLTLFNHQGELGKQYKQGRMGTAAGFNWGMDQSIASHTVGAVVGTPLINGATADGASTLVLDGITGSITGCYKKGDVITLAGVYAVHPQTKQSTGQLKQFVVTADTDSSSGAIASLPISPAIRSTGAYQNVDALPADNAPVNLFGSPAAHAGKVSAANLAYHKDAFVLGMADLVLPGGTDMAARAVDPDAGLSIRIVRDYDINNDRFPCRLDVLYGWKTIYEELACRVHA